MGKDCSGCRKGLYDYEKSYDLLKQLVVAGDNDAKSDLNHSVEENYSVPNKPEENKV